jgi:microcystin-dependent protein
VQLRVIEDVAGINDASIISTPLSEWVASDLIPTYISATSFSVPGDNTTTFTVGRRLKIIISGSIVYSSILTSTFAAGKTTLTISNDSTAIDNTMSAVAYGLLDPTNSSIVQSGVSASILSVGIIYMFAGGGAQVPNNCLIVGPTVVNVSRTGAYAALFAAIGTYWGAGDGSTTFGLPFLANNETFIADATVLPGSHDNGQMPSHDHTYTFATNPAYGVTGGGGVPAWTGTTTINTGTDGSGSANLPAGRVVRYIIRYK